MKFLQALAGLALLFPLATVGQSTNDPPRCFDSSNNGIEVDGVCANSCGNGGAFNCEDVCNALGVLPVGPQQCNNAGDQDGFNGNNICGDWYGSKGNTRKTCCTCSGCGDGEIQDGEECEPRNSPGCSDTCQITSVCGNDIVEFGEQCDPPDGVTCSATCQDIVVLPFCGDGIRNGAEQCDDGNNDNNDACTNACTTPSCGDNIVNGDEQCDPPDFETCSATCQELPYCGDGFQNGAEQCDDGNNVDGDGCSSTCEFETGGGGTQGDPHFKTWRGHHFDFHGECDLVLLHSSEFGSGLGLDVHIRTKLRRDMSYISSATLRIGKDILEVESQGIYYMNGVLGAKLPEEFSGFAFSHTKPTDNLNVFAVHSGVEERINIKTYKDFVSILIEKGQSKHFGDSVGLMGDFGKGRMLARDGQTILDDANAFGQEWQVLESEDSFFQRLRLPQHPMECTLPPPMQASQIRRRLLESSIDELTAEKACEQWGEGKDDCVFDVLTTGDLEMAMVGAY
jgi:cysteine-rich repeat protein